jgi:hypothetical protein
MPRAHNTSKSEKDEKDGNPAPQGGNVCSAGRHLRPELPPANLVAWCDTAYEVEGR